MFTNGRMGAEDRGYAEDRELWGNGKKIYGCVTIGWVL